MKQNIIEKAKDKYDEYIKRQEAIVDIAIKLFNEKGYKSVKTAEISREAGISEPTLYSHFNSKKDLYIECSKYVIDELLAMYREIYKSFSDNEAIWIKEICRSYINYMNMNPHKSMFMIHLLSTKSDPDFYKIMKDFMAMNIETLEKMLKRAKSKGKLHGNFNIHNLSSMFANIFFTISAARQFSNEDEIPVDEYAEIILRMLGLEE
jgi:AcrR family transcriptional regulator